MKKKRLELKKKVIASLTDAEKKQIMGGANYTTTFSECTHFLCCGYGCEYDPDPTIGDYKSKAPEICYTTQDFPCPTDPTCNTPGFMSC